MSLRKAFPNNSSANIKLSKTYLHKIGQSRGFLGRLSGTLLRSGLSLMKNILRTTAKSILIPLVLTITASATDASSQQKIFGSNTTTLIISNEELHNIIKVIKSLEESVLLINGITKTTQSETKEQESGFLTQRLIRYIRG